MRITRPRATKIDQITINAPLDMGVYDLIVGGLNFFVHTANLKQLIKQVHPTLQVLGTMDETTYFEITKIGNNYIILTGGVYDVYDEHNDNVVDEVTNWTITLGQGGTKSVTEVDLEHMYVRAYATGPGGSEAQADSQISKSRWHARIKANESSEFGPATRTTQLKVIGSATHTLSIPQDNLYREYEIEKVGGVLKIYENLIEKLSEADANETFTIQYYCRGWRDVETGHAQALMYIDKTGATGSAYTVGEITGTIISNELSTDSALLSFFKHLKGKFINGVGNTHATPVQVEIYGDVDAYAAALNGTTKFTMDPGDPLIDFYREDVSEVAKGALQTTWIMDDNVTNGALPTKTGATHSTILAEEIGVASISSVEKSILGDFSDTVVLVEEEDYVVDYSTRTATKIILADGTGITTSSKLLIRWIADVMDIEAVTNITALKLKIYLNRTATSEASPEILPLDIGTLKYAEMQYGA